MLMPMGKFAGQPIDELPTPYLSWLVSQDHVRFSRWPLVEGIIHVLAERFGKLDVLLDELHVTEAPPPRWKTPEREAALTRARTAKLAALEERRRAALKRIADDLRERIERSRQASRQPSLEPEPGVWRDASYYVREARRRQAQDPYDASDLV